VTVIVIAAAVIATILGLWGWGRQRQGRYDDEDEHQGEVYPRCIVALTDVGSGGVDFIAPQPQSSWR